MAITLSDYFKQSKDPIHKAFIADLLRYSPIMGEIPFTSVPGMQVSAIRWQTLPSAAFRSIGSGYTEGTGTTENLEETLFALGGDVKVDRLLQKATNVYEDPLVTQMKMKAKAVAFEFNRCFFAGSHAINADEFEGLTVRVSNAPTRMTLYLDASGAGTGASLKVLASTANTNTFLDALAQASKYVEGATHLFCNEDTYLRFEMALRRTTAPSLLSIAKDSFDREILSYRNLRLMDVGLQRDKSTEIISLTEDPGNGANDSTSMYVARIDTDDGLHGIQLEGTSPEPYDPLAGGELESGPQVLRRIDWAIGLMNVSNYSVARIRGFRMRAT